MALLSVGCNACNGIAAEGASVSCKSEFFLLHSNQVLIVYGSTSCVYSQVVTCAFLRVISRHPIFRDLARHAFLGVVAGGPYSRCGGHLEAPPGMPPFPLGGESFGVPFDFCLFLPLPSIRRRVRAASPVAAQLLQAYDDPNVGLLQKRKSSEFQLHL